MPAERHKDWDGGRDAPGTLGGPGSRDVCSNREGRRGLLVGCNWRLKYEMAPVMVVAVGVGMLLNILRGGLCILDIWEWHCLTLKQNAWPQLPFHFAPMVGFAEAPCVPNYSVSNVYFRVNTSLAVYHCYTLAAKSHVPSKTKTPSPSVTTTRPNPQSNLIANPVSFWKPAKLYTVKDTPNSYVPTPRSDPTHHALFFAYIYLTM